MPAHPRTAAAPTATPPGRPGPRTVVGLLVLVELVSGALQGWYPPLLPGIDALLDVGVGPLNWFNSVQLLAAAVSVPVLTALGDRYGHRRLLQASVLSVLAGAALIAAAPSYPALLAGRALQGPLAAWIALEIGLVRGRLSGPAAHRAIGALAGALTAGSLLGGLFSGPLYTALGDVRLTLIAPAVLVALCAAVVTAWVPESHTRTAHRIDWLGAAGLSAALILLLSGLSQAGRSGWTSAGAAGALGLGATVLAGWVAFERRTAAPLVDLRVFAGPALGPVLAATLLFGITLFGNQVPIVTFLSADPAVTGYGFALSPSVLAVVLAVNVAAAVAGAALYGPAAVRLGSHAVLPVGTALVAAGLLTLTLGWARLPIVLAALPLTGLGSGLLLGGLPAHISEVAPPDRVGIASGTYSTVKVFGGAVATAVIGGLLAGFVPAGAAEPTVAGYRVVWLSCAAAALGALALLLTARARHRRTAR